MNYLIYIERAAENLQFFLWYRDYSKRFSEIPASERVLAPEWTAAQAEAANQSTQTQATNQKQPSTEAAAVLEGTTFASGPAAKLAAANGGDPFETPPRTPGGDMASEQGDWKSGTGDDVSTLKPSEKSFNNKASEAFEGADLKWQPCTPSLELRLSSTIC